MRKSLAVAILIMIGTAAEAATFQFPSPTSLEHTSTFNGTVRAANMAGVVLATAGDYIQDSQTLPTALTFSSYSFTAPLLGGGTAVTENFSILLNGSTIGSFSVTPQDVSLGSISGSGSFAPLTISGLNTLRVQLTNTIPDDTRGFGVGTTGTFTLNDAAVPEPISWAMFIGGFGLVGFTMRRRRVNVRFA